MTTIKASHKLHQAISHQYQNEKRPMSQPKALIDEELPGTTGLVALKFSLYVWWH